MEPAITHAPRAADRVLVLAPAGLLLVVGLVLAIQNGGYPSTTWYPAALFVLALVAVVLAVAFPPPRERWAGVRGVNVALLLFAAWSFASVAWAVVPGLAWDGANRTLLYALVLLLATLRPWSPTTTRALLVGVLLVLVGLAIGVLLTSGGSSLHSTFLVERLAAPTGYTNATPNLWLIGCLPAAWLACDPALRWPLRGACLGAAGFLAEVALLSQSRGAVLAGSVAAVLLVAMAPRRWPVLVALAAIAGTVIATSGPVFAVHEATPARMAHEYSRACVVIAIGAVVLTLAGWAAAAADRAISRRLGSATRGRGDLALVGLVVLGLIAFFVAIGDPSTWARARWDDFKTSGYAAVDSGGSRFTGSLGSARYDLYRVGLDDFLARPVGGVGVDSFGPGYLEHGHSGDTPKYSHSLVIALLAETGAVGTALFAAFIALCAAAALRARRLARGSPASGPAVAVLAGFTVFIVGCSVDWLWQFPALGVLAFLLLAPAIHTRSAEAVELPAPRETSRRLVLRLLGVALALGAAASFALPGIAARFTAAAYDQSATDPALAVRRLDRAASYNPLSADPLLAKAIVLRRLGRTGQERAALDQAIAREPHNWFAYFERAMLEARLARWPAARRDLAVAARLNPKQPVVGEVVTAFIAEHSVDPARIEAQLALQVTRKTHPEG